MGKKKEKGLSNGLMGVVIMEISRKTICMEKANMFGLTRKNTMETGSTTIWMVILSRKLSNCGSTCRQWSFHL